MFRRRLEATAAPELLFYAICAGSLFRHFASLHGIEKDIQIVALNRSGSYACELAAKRNVSFKAPSGARSFTSK